MNTMGYCKTCKQEFVGKGQLCVTCKHAKNQRGTLEETLAWCKIQADIQNYDLDVAASDQLHVCDQYMTKEDDGLASTWYGHVWCNPPYDNIGAWVTKAWEQYKNCSSISMLIPANRTEQDWWQEEVEIFRDCEDERLSTFFLPKRTRFKHPDGTPFKGSPPFACVLLVWKP